MKENKFVIPHTIINKNIQITNNNLTIGDSPNNSELEGQISYCSIMCVCKEVNDVKSYMHEIFHAYSSVIDDEIKSNCNDYIVTEKGAKFKVSRKCYVFTILDQEYLESNSVPVTSLFLTYRKAFGTSVKIKRIDCYFDDYKQDVTIQKVGLAIENEDWVSHFEDYKHIKSGKRTKNRRTQPLNANLGQTVYLGKRHSDFLVRFYDKKSQAKLEYPLTRIEIEIKGQLASQIFNQFLETSEYLWPQVCFGLLIERIDFRQRDVDSNISRCPQLPWWQNFIKNKPTIKPKITNSRRKPPKKVEEIWTWLKSKVSPSLALIYSIYGQEAISDLINIGEKRFTTQHKVLIKQANSVLKEQKV